jgi:hypothetical protein
MMRQIFGTPEKLVLSSRGRFGERLQPALLE